MASERPHSSGRSGSPAAWSHSRAVDHPATSKGPPFVDAPMNATPAFCRVDAATPVRSTPAPPLAPSRQIRVDLVDGLAIETSANHGFVPGPRERQTNDTRTAAPSITHGSSLHASKIRRSWRWQSCSVTSVRAAPNGVGRNKPRALRPCPKRSAGLPSRTSNRRDRLSAGTRPE